MTGLDGLDDDDDTCGCVGYGGKQCDYHAQAARARDEADRRFFRSRGVNPDAEVTNDLLDIMLKVETSPSLSLQQRWAIKRILFPAGKP
jgi:hypothetical protein